MEAHDEKVKIILMKTKTWKFVLLVTAMVAVTSMPADAIPGFTLLKISGHTLDSLGRPLAGVTVSDGEQSVISGSDGSYELREAATGQFTLTGTRSDLDQGRIVVDAPLPLDVADADMTLSYRLWGSLPSPKMSTAAGAVSRALSVFTYAPLPGTVGESGGKSCVSVKDSRSQTSQPATWVSTSPSGLSTWTWALEVPQLEQPGIYSLTPIATSCDSPVALSAVPGPSIVYVVDNSAPAFDPSSLLPGDFANTVYPSGPVVVRLKDRGPSGIDPSTLAVSVKDESSGTTLNFGASSLSYDASTYWLATPTIDFIGGHVYRTKVTVGDHAGNVAVLEQTPIADGGGFLAISVVAHKAMGGIPPSPCSLSAGSTPATKTATCSNVPVNFDATAVDLSGSRHGGDVGFVDQTLSLATARIVSSSLPAGVPAYNQFDPAWSPKTRSLPFEVPAATSTAQTLTVPAYETVLDGVTLTAQVPSTWTDASITMLPVSASDASISTCRDPRPSTRLLTCTPDPVGRKLAMHVADSAPTAAGVGATLARKFDARVATAFEIPVRGLLAWVPQRSFDAVAVEPAVTATVPFGGVSLGPSSMTQSEVGSIAPQKLDANSPGGTNPCDVWFDYGAFYQRSGNVYKETTSANARTGCNADRIPTLKMNVTLTHFCFGGQEATDDKQSGSGKGPVYASAEQYVMIEEILAPRYCGWGSIILWTYHLHVESSLGNQLDLCAKLTASVPGSINGGQKIPCTDLGIMPLPQYLPNP